jgi:shikimate kinase
MNHVWLIGMMGTGKTTVGAIVAELLSLPLIDADAEVMERSGRTIPELFADSEATFRRWEADVILTISEGPRSVVSTGGGAILDPRNVLLMRNTGTTVLLTSDSDELDRRLQESNDAERPLHDDLSSLKRLQAERRLAYAAAADHTIDTTDLDQHTVAEKVMACIAT